jgi:hypothetical protein
MPTSGHFVTMGFRPLGNIDILHVRLYIRLENFNFHPDRFSSNGAPSAVKSRPTNTSQNKSINLLMHLLGGHDAKLTVYLYEGFTFGHLVLVVINLSLYEMYDVWYGNDKINLVTRRYTRSTVMMLLTVWVPTLDYHKPADYGP